MVFSAWSNFQSPITYFYLFQVRDRRRILPNIRKQWCPQKKKSSNSYYEEKRRHGIEKFWSGKGSCLIVKRVTKYFWYYKNSSHFNFKVNALYSSRKLYFNVQILINSKSLPHWKSFKKIPMFFWVISFNLRRIFQICWKKPLRAEFSIFNYDFPLKYNLQVSG